MRKKTWNERRRRLFEIIEVGAGDDIISRAYDFFSAILVVVYIIVSILDTYDNIRQAAGAYLTAAEVIIVVFFTIDYVLRLFTAKYLHPDDTEGRALRKYVLSFAGIVDLFSFLPYYLPVFFPAGAIVFRMFRVIRIFRLFRINTYYDSLNVITEVIVSKRQQLISSVFIILVLMLASSLCMYSTEHAAQPEVFKNAFSGVWWAVSTLLTVGYGDIYPVTTLGRILSIVITFLGVGMVAIPTGIISAGFVDQYAQMKKRSDYLFEQDVRFVRAALRKGDPWIGQKLGALELPQALMIAAVRRDGSTLLPQPDIVLAENDVIVLGAEPHTDGRDIDLKEIVLNEHSPWVGERIRDLDISRKTLIVMVCRKNKVIIPDGNLLFKEGDKVFIYTESRMKNAAKVVL